MAPPRFSVVIPTRERPQTLRSTLQTCLDQDFDDYEVVVCDNHGSPATREVVEAFASPRVKYVRAPRPLSMGDNWELAVGHAAGEYVTVLGDDDGLLSHALAELDRLVARTGARAVRWSGACYTWPNVAVEGEGNYLVMPFFRELHTVQAADAIAGVIGFREHYAYLPMLYNAVIHRDLLAELRGKAGRLFANGYPDVYSGFTFAHLAGTYVSVSLPMSVSGLSGGSSGVAVLYVRDHSPVAADFYRLNAGAGRAPHPWVPDLPLLPAVVADCFLHAKEALFPDDSRLVLDRKALAAQCVGALWASGPGQWRDRLATIRASLADDADLQSWFDATLGGEPYRPSATPPLMSGPLGFDGSQLRVRADAFGMTDVAGAARLCEHLLGVRGTEVRYDVPGHPWLKAQAAWAAEELARVKGWLEVSEADRAARLDVIHRLDAYAKDREADCAARLEVIQSLTERLRASEAERAAQAAEAHTLREQLAAEARLLREQLAVSEAGLAAQRSQAHSLWLEGVALREELAAERAALGSRLGRAPRRLLRWLRKAG